MAMFKLTKLTKKVAKYFKCGDGSPTRIACLIVDLLVQCCLKVINQATCMYLSVPIVH